MIFLAENQSKPKKENNAFNSQIKFLERKSFRSPFFRCFQGVQRVQHPFNFLLVFALFWDEIFDLLGPIGASAGLQLRIKLVVQAADELFAGARDSILCCGSVHEPNIAGREPANATIQRAFPPEEEKISDFFASMPDLKPELTILRPTAEWPWSHHSWRKWAEIWGKNWIDQSRRTLPIPWKLFKKFSPELK